MDHLREGARFRKDILGIAIKTIVEEGYQENLISFADAYNAWDAADMFNMHKLLNWDKEAA